MEGAAQDPAEKEKEKEAARREGQPLARRQAAAAGLGEKPEGQLAGGVCPGSQAPASGERAAHCAPALSETGSECFSNQFVTS